MAATQRPLTANVLSALACRVLAVVGLAVVALLVLGAAPASAHAELVSTSPHDGARLDTAPHAVTLVFTEDVELIDGGMHLLDRAGRTVPEGTPRVSGHTVVWPMSKTLPRGTYLVNWRVVSADGHPVAGAFSFGVASAAQALPSSTHRPADTAPWWVLVVRFLGYVSFAGVVGVVVFVIWCSPASVSDPRLDRLLAGAMAGGLLSTGAGLLVQGPYTAGTGLGHLLAHRQLTQVSGSPFGQALEGRLLLYAVLLVMLALDWSTSPGLRLAVPGILSMQGVTFAASGHAGAQGHLLDLAADTIHVLAASIWVGGLLVLALIRPGTQSAALQRFSSLAMVSVLALVTTGVVNAVLHVHQPDDLLHTRYGVVLTVKLLVTAAALAAAAVSRHSLHERTPVLSSIRVEAMATVAVLALTSVLTLTSPPPTVRDTASEVPQGRSPDSAAGQDGTNTATAALLGGNHATIRVDPPTTGHAQVTVTVRDVRHRIVKAGDLRLQASLPARDIKNLDIALVRHGDAWSGPFSFPLTGRWIFGLTVQDRDLTAVVATAALVIASAHLACEAARCRIGGRERCARQAVMCVTPTPQQP